MAEQDKTSLAASGAGTTVARAGAYTKHGVETRATAGVFIQNSACLSDSRKASGRRC